MALIKLNRNITDTDTDTDIGIQRVNTIATSTGFAADQSAASLITAGTFDGSFSDSGVQVNRASSIPLGNQLDRDGRQCPWSWRAEQVL